jgi:hypothetical protein
VVEELASTSLFLAPAGFDAPSLISLNQRLFIFFQETELFSVGQDVYLLLFPIVRNTSEDRQAIPVAMPGVVDKTK